MVRIRAFHACGQGSICFKQIDLMIYTAQYEYPCGGAIFFVARILIYVHMPYAHDVSQDIKDMFGFFFIKMRLY